MNIIQTLMYPPVLMAECSFFFIGLTTVQKHWPLIPAWRFWLGMVVLLGGVGNFAVRIGYGIWRMHA